MQHRLWGSETRVLLARALSETELTDLAAALDSPDGRELIREEIDQVRRARRVAPQARERVREAARSRTLQQLEVEYEELRQYVSLGYTEEAVERLERDRILALMYATRWPRYRPQDDPGA